MIRIIKDDKVVFESDDLYKVADWLYYDDIQVKMLEVRPNKEAYDEAKIIER